MQEAYLRADPYDLWGPGVMDTAVPVTVAGLPAFKTTYRVYIGEPAYDLRDVWIPKDDELPSKITEEQKNILKPIIEKQINKDRFSVVFESLSENEQPMMITQP